MRTTMWAVLIGCAWCATGHAQEVPPVVAPPVVAPPPTLLEKVQPPPPVKVWCGGVELGLSGADGNSENFNMRFGTNLKRKTADNLLTFDLLYRYATSGSLRTENRLLSTGRDEHLFIGTPWSVFADLSLEYDEFKAFDVRLASHAGVGYLILKTDRMFLKSRAGVGVAKEFGELDEKWVPEGVLGMEFERRMTERGKLTASVDYFPSFESMDRFRVTSKVAYEWLIDPEWNVTLKIGALDRYDSQTSRKNPKNNDLEYFATILWKF